MNIDQFRNLKLSSKNGNKKSQYKLGILYIKGEVIRQNIDKGLYFLKQSSVNGYSKAQYELAINFLIINNIEGENTKECFRLLKLSSDNGYVKSHFQLAFFYLNGIYIPKDYNESFRLFKLSLDNGFIESAFHIGFIFEKKNDLEEAYKYYQICSHFHYNAKVKCKTFIENNKQNF